MQSVSLTRGNILPRVFLGLFGSLLFAAVGVVAGSFVPVRMLQVLMFVELAMIFGAMFLQRRRSIGYSFVYAFTFISGMTLFPVIAYYTGTLGAGTVLEAMGVTAVSFLAAAGVASRSSFDFSFLRGFLFIGLIALVLVGLLSFFVGFSSSLQMGYTMLGIAVFIGFVLFDVNRISRVGVAESQIPWVVLSLYLDVINLFLFILRLMGLNVSGRR
ncbi:Bax inhibitor-1/YccA family protein [Alicyclobacillaceae bacterium I2511]|nr:Bax inhibitor-1/YccA family protein [Alicyclobacillaceae bacterium I2511]